MEKKLTDRQFAEIETAILHLRNRVDLIRIRYAMYVGIDLDSYSDLPFDDCNPIYDALNAAAASLEEAYEIFD